MATIQQVHILAAPINFPGVLPTAASPCPIFGLPAARVQGVATYSNTANPAGNASVNMDYFVANQKFTGTLIVSETVAAIIAAS